MLMRVVMTMAIPKGLSFDQLNQLYREEHEDRMRSMPYEEYFGEMDLSDEQKEKRIETAKEIEEFTILALLSMYYLYAEGIYDYSVPMSGMSNSYSQMLQRMGVPLTEHFGNSHVNSTIADITSATIAHPNDPYYFSVDRAILIAENEANSIWNDSEHQDAILTGKRRKTWSAIIDKATRDTHRDVNGVTIPIGQPFEVGESLMMYPRDTSLGASSSEISNCRCSVIYS